MQVAKKIVDALLGQIEAERRGNAVDRGLLANVLRMLDALGLYAEAFERPFNQQTELFYAAEGVSGLSSMEVPEYLLHSEVRLSWVALLLPWHCACCDAEAQRPPSAAAATTGQKVWIQACAGSLQQWPASHSSSRQKLPAT